jgi:hypothetical protein
MQNSLDTDSAEIFSVPTNESKNKTISLKTTRNLISGGFLFFFGNGLIIFEGNINRKKLRQLTQLLVYTRKFVSPVQVSGNRSLDSNEKLKF